MRSINFRKLAKTPRVFPHDLTTTCALVRRRTTKPLRPQSNRCRICPLHPQSMASRAPEQGGHNHQTIDCLNYSRPQQPPTWKKVYLGFYKQSTLRTLNKSDVGINCDHQLRYVSRRRHTKMPTPSSGPLARSNEFSRETLQAVNTSESISVRAPYIMQERNHYGSEWGTLSARNKQQQQEHNMNEIPLKSEDQLLRKLS